MNARRWKFLDVSPYDVLKWTYSMVLTRRHHQSAHPEAFAWDWKAPHFDRIALVNHLVSVTGGLDCKYLEIGCAGNALFDAVATLDKTGVDPVSGGTHRMTSDTFFASTDATFDVIFIDGLHEYQQVRRDAVHALERLRPGGWIAFHDLLPRTWKEHHVPRLQSDWTGDCWKAAVEISRADGLEFHVVTIDHGVGILRKTRPAWSIPDMSSTLLDAQFDVFTGFVNDLPLIDVQQALEVIAADS
jgi:hypothetical protein